MSKKFTQVFHFQLVNIRAKSHLSLFAYLFVPSIIFEANLKNLFLSNEH